MTHLQALWRHDLMRAAALKVEARIDDLQVEARYALAKLASALSVEIALRTSLIRSLAKGERSANARSLDLSGSEEGSRSNARPALSTYSLGRQL